MQAPRNAVISMANEFGTNVQRTATTANDTFFLHTAAVIKKNRYTFFYADPPIQPVPIAYTATDTSGNRVGVWKLQTLSGLQWKQSARHGSMQCLKLGSACHGKRSKYF